MSKTWELRIATRAYAPLGYWKLVSEDLEAPPEPNAEAFLGWLSPNGQLYGCDLGDHNYLQACLEKHFGIEDLQTGNSRGGWMQLSVQRSSRSPEWGWPLAETTKAQQRAIMDWCELYGEPLPEFLTVRPEEYYTLNVPPGF